MEIIEIDQWFKDNPKGLRESFIPFGGKTKTTKPIEVCDIINHKDFMKTCIYMLNKGIKTAYYLAKARDYINDYNNKKQ